MIFNMSRKDLLIFLGLTASLVLVVFIRLQTIQDQTALIISNQQAAYKAEQAANERGNQTINAIFATLDTIESVLQNSIRYQLEATLVRQFLVFNRTLHATNNTDLIMNQTQIATQYHDQLLKGIKDLKNLTIIYHNETIPKVKPGEHEQRKYFPLSTSKE